jgi:hypothetical protein
MPKFRINNGTENNAKTAEAPARESPRMAFFVSLVPGEEEFTESRIRSTL